MQLVLAPSNLNGSTWAKLSVSTFIAAKRLTFGVFVKLERSS
jgi:hypothetical protein